MARKVEFFQRSNYGAPARIYIKDSVTAGKLETLTGKRTYSEGDLSILASLGVEFVEVPDPRYTPLPSQEARERAWQALVQSGGIG